MTHLLCSICDRVDKPDEFLAQHCGHVFCKHCVSQLSNCPKCRTEWGPRIPFRLFLDFPDTSVFRRLYNRLENMGEETSSVLADKTSDIIRKFVEDSSSGHDASQAVALLEAVERLEKRVMPLFSDLERVREENSLLRQKLAAYQLDIQSKEGLAAQIEEMNHAMAEQNQNLLSVGDELACEKKKRSLEEKANHRLVRSVRKKQEEINIKEREIDSLRSTIEERDKQLHLQKRKLRELTRRLKTTSVVQDVDDSLIVEPPLSDIVNDDSLQSPHKPEAKSSFSPPLSILFSTHKRRKTET